MGRAMVFHGARFSTTLLSGTEQGRVASVRGSWGFALLHILCIGGTICRALCVQPYHKELEEVATIKFQEREAYCGHACGFEFQKLQDCGGRGSGV